MFATGKGVGEKYRFPRGGEQWSVENREVLKNKSANFYSRGASSIATAAALSVAILIAATGSYIGEKASATRITQVDTARAPAERQEYVPVADADGNGIPDWQDELMKGGIAVSTSTGQGIGTTSDPVASVGSSLAQSLVSGYLSLKEYEAYTPERGEQLANTLVSGFRAPTIFEPHTEAALTIDPETSQERILRYRSDMREALSGIVDLNAEPEFSLFARFVATNNRTWLDKLSLSASQYRAAEAKALEVAVPEPAAAAHLRAVNAIGEFAETLERLVRFSSDPLATMALLRTYNDTEREIFLAFDALAEFYVHEVGSN